MQAKYSAICRNTWNCCTGQTFIHVRFQVQLWPRKTVTQEILSINLKFYYFRRGTPRKMTSTLILGLAHYYLGATFRRDILHRYTKTIIFKTLFSHLHNQCPPQPDSSNPGSALAIVYPHFLTPTLYWITREIIWPLSIKLPRTATTMKKSTSQNRTMILQWLFLHP